MACEDCETKRENSKLQIVINSYVRGTERTNESHHYASLRDEGLTDSEAVERLQYEKRNHCVHKPEGA